MNNKPCPFCGSHNIGVDETDGYKWIAVRCSECGAIGPEVRAQDIRPAALPEFSERDHLSAFAEWNRRAAIGESGDGK